VILPFVTRYADESAVVAWDLFNEPEWAVFGLGGRLPRATSAAIFRSFLEETVARLRGVGTQPLTVGLASARGLGLVRGLDLGFRQIHWYDWVERHCPLERPVAELDSEGPFVLGEFPTRGSARSVAAILDTAQRAGFTSVWPWSFLAEDEATDLGAGAERAAAWAADQPRLNAEETRLPSGPATPSSA
jgi:hypothetical protein